MKNYLKKAISKGTSRKQSLVEDNLDYAHFKGVIFTNANLEQRNFRSTSFGIKMHWGTLLFFISFVLVILAGCILGGGSFLSVFFLIGSPQLIHGVPVLLSLAISLFTILQRGFPLGIITGITALVPFLLLSIVTPADKSGGDIGLPLFFGIGAIILVAFGIAIMALSIVLLTVTVEALPAVTMIVFVSVFIVSAATMKTLMAAPIATVALVLASYISWQALGGDRRFH